jgi:hypothetical protein
MAKQPNPEGTRRFTCNLPEDLLRRLVAAAAADRRDMTGMIIVTLDRSLPPLPVVGAANGEAR